MVSTPYIIRENTTGVMSFIGDDNHRVVFITIYTKRFK